ncbi:N-acetylglucosaminylphosphatidylinositol deacetylase [Corynebacterium ammoniagenes DSM 20306]|nr:GlcNAc-PI de-N-acetylase [Corynebacterium ammoniagenes]EFG80573.1 N-acetylglucosaminylphosphatidylinositol deacetylase [Corynebacterium ammoniagenes DSM 20306]
MLVPNFGAVVDLLDSGTCDSLAVWKSMELEVLNAEEVERVLVVVAHPDDAEYGLSVAVNNFTAAGKEVGYLLLTAGEAGIRDMEPEKTKALREKEQRAACDEVGVEHLTILDFPDGEMEYGLDVRKAIAKEIREFKPDTVAVINFEFWAAWGINHIDHRVTGEVTIDAIRDADNPWTHRDLTEEPWKAQRLLISGSSEPSHRLPVTDADVQAGVRSLEHHKVYLEALPDHPKPADFIPAMITHEGDEQYLSLRVVNM